MAPTDDDHGVHGQFAQHQPGSAPGLHSLSKKLSHVR